MSPPKTNRWIDKHEPSHKVLQEINHLEKSSPNFPDRLTSILSSNKYEDPSFFARVQSEDRVWLIEYLDNVCVCVHQSHSLLSLHRPSMLLTLPILRTKNAYSKFKGYVALRRGYHHRTSLVLPPQSPSPIEPLLGLMKPSTKCRGKASGFVPKN